MVVGEIRRLPRPTESNLRAHDLAVQALLQRAPALLPARFGTHVADPGELAAVLRSQRDVLRRRLKAVRHRVQMTIRLLDPGSQDGGSGKAGPRTVIPRTSGYDYLRARAVALAREQALPSFEPLRAAVSRFVRDERVERRKAVATVYHLIPQASVGDYRRAIGRATRESGVRVVVTGPWAPYAFVDQLLA